MDLRRLPSSVSNFDMSITLPPAGDSIIVSKLLNLKLHGWPTGGRGGITWYDSVEMLIRAPLCDDCIVYAGIDTDKDKYSIF